MVGSKFSNLLFVISAKNTNDQANYISCPLINSQITPIGKWGGGFKRTTLFTIIVTCTTPHYLIYRLLFMVFHREPLKILSMTLHVLLQIIHISLNTKYKSRKVHQTGFLFFSAQMKIVQYWR